MCGVPVHSYENYLQRLIRYGFKVAICEQVEDPAVAKKRGAKTVVEAGSRTRCHAGHLGRGYAPRRAGQQLFGCDRAGRTQPSHRLGRCFYGGMLPQPPTEQARMAGELGRLNPRELLVADRLVEMPELGEILADWDSVLTTLPAARFDSQGAERRLEESYGVATLEGFGAFGRAELAALGGLLHYVELTQRGKLPGLKPPVRVQANAAMLIDSATRRNL